MARPDAALLDPARYPFRCLIEPRFSDLDTNLHINNGAIAGILEEARVRFHRASDCLAMQDGMVSMVASLAIEFVGQSFYPDPLEVHVAPSRLGRTSYALAQLVLQQGRPVIHAASTLVCMRDGAPVPLPDDWRGRIDGWMLRP